MGGSKSMFFHKANSVLYENTETQLIDACMSIFHKLKNLITQPHLLYLFYSIVNNYDILTGPNFVILEHLDFVILEHLAFEN